MGCDQSIAERPRNLVVLLVDVAEAMCLIEDYEIPGNRFDQCRAGCCKLVAHNEDCLVSQEWILRACLARGGKGLAVKDKGGKEEFVRELGAPLLADRSWKDEENAAVARGPELGEDDAAFDSFAEAGLVRKERATGKR